MYTPQRPIYLHFTTLGHINPFDIYPVPWAIFLVPFQVNYRELYLRQLELTFFYCIYLQTIYHPLLYF